MKALLEAEGRSIDSVSVDELTQRFGISEFSIRKGMREIQAPSKK
jgi:DeoR/GlpR family transcriptional regulator of sugar metabolism